MAVEPLPAEALYRRYDPERLPFETTAEVVAEEPLDALVGQARAVEALRFGAQMAQPGYNLFAVGSPGLGKRSVVLRYLEVLAAQRPAPDDWCYVENFDDERRPRALCLPPGRAVAFRKDVKALVDELRDEIPAAFESRTYREKREALDKGYEESRKAALEEVEKGARERGIAVVQTPVGVGITPVRDGQPLGPKEIEALPEEERGRVRAAVEEVQKRLKEVLESARSREREHREAVRRLNRDLVHDLVEEPLARLRQRWEELEPVAAWLGRMEQDLVEHAKDFLGARERKPGDLEQDDDGEQALLRQLAQTQTFRRWEVNVLTAHPADGGAPVVAEERPSAKNLMGRIEHQARFGALVTDFTLIRPGALHRANGGWLVLDARKVLMHALAWEELKRALRAGRVVMESLRELAVSASTVSLEPEPVPLDAKVVLLGDRLLLQLLREADPDFDKLFKVVVDFDERMERSDENAVRYARLLAHLARTESLLAFDRGAVARLVEHGSRLVDDAEKLSTHLMVLGDLAQQADHFAREGGRDLVKAEDVQAAIDAQLRRTGRLADLVREEIRRGRFLVDTTGERVGQVNGLSVMGYVGRTFGRPMRITARIRLGGGRVVDIERESKLGGPLHSKGVLILSGYLAGRYLTEVPLSLSASLVFEQSYGPVEGDSATLAELCALLSAVAEVPIRQGIAVTGSVNQQGDVQPIGGANDKIESFFDVCRDAGLDGTQGVVVPAGNVGDLMLDRALVAAAREGRFGVWPVRTVDEAVSILTGQPAGERGPDGRFPEGTVNAAVERRLTLLAEKAKHFRQGRREGD